MSITRVTSLRPVTYFSISAEPILEDNTHVNDIEYSPLVCGFGITLNDGRAAYLTAPNLKFDPNVSFITKLIASNIQAP